MDKPAKRALFKARDAFHELLSRTTKESEWQRFFTENPFVLSMSLPLRLEPNDIIPLARPGRTEPDFVFYPHTAIRPGSIYGAIELKRPDTKLISVPRSNAAILTRDAQTAIQQALVWTRDPYDFVPIPRADDMLFLGNAAYVFVIIGMRKELAEKLSRDIFREMIADTVPRNVQLIPYDSLLSLFEAKLPPRLYFLTPFQSALKLPLIAISVPSDAWGQVRSRRYSSTPEQQFAIAEFGESVFHYANDGGPWSEAGAAGEAMDNWDHRFFRKSLKGIKEHWCLDAALVRGQILLRAGYVWNGDDDNGRVAEKLWDEALWIFNDNANEIWVDVYAEDLHKEIVLNHNGVDLLKIAFKKSTKTLGLEFE